VEKTAAGDGSSDGTAIGNGAAERALAVKGNGCEVTTSEGGEAKGDADKASDGGAPTGGLAQTFDLFSFASMFRYTDRADALLMAIGTVGALANGMGLPLFSLIFGDLLDSLNDTLDVRSAVDDKVKWLGILAGGTLVAGWAQIAFWTLAGERLMGHVREVRSRMLERASMPPTPPHAHLNLLAHAGVPQSGAAPGRSLLRRRIATRRHVCRARPRRGVHDRGGRTKRGPGNSVRDNVHRRAHYRIHQGLARGASCASLHSTLHPRVGGARNRADGSGEEVKRGVRIRGQHRK